MTLSVPLCALCVRQVAGEHVNDVDTVENAYECALCFGILDPEFIDEVSREVEKALQSSPYDATSFVLALGLPGSQMLREVILRKAYPQFNGTLGHSVPFKIRNIDAYLKKLSNASGLRPTLASDLMLIISFENDEFGESDKRFLMNAFPNDLRRGKKKWNEPEETELTKMQITSLLGRIDEDIAKTYPFARPTRKCTYSITLERDPVYVAGRYCKFSRSLPQSPWAPEEGVPKFPGNSVTEKICEVLRHEFGADNTRFVTSGREDVDVRMLGDGRPFVVHLINCRHIKSLNGLKYLETLKDMEHKINQDPDIQVIGLTRVTRDEAEQLSFGEEDKKKSYTAYCYSTLPITESSFEEAKKHFPLEIIQKTPVRVMKRRALLDRPRTIFAMDTLLLDAHHFLIRLETQAGTYIKEFVHGDFGRTRPSLADILGVEKGEVDILELDVEKVHLQWPPHRDEKYFFK